MEKPPFKLPTLIEATGIAKLRDSYAGARRAKIVKIKSEGYENREIRTDRYRLPSHARCSFQVSNETEDDEDGRFVFWKAKSTRFL